MSKRVCRRAIVAAILAVGLVVAAQAQESSTQPPAPAGDVLDRVPAGCMGFFVVNNVEKFGGKIDGFIGQIFPPGQSPMPARYWI